MLHKYMFNGIIDINCNRAKLAEAIQIEKFNGWIKTDLVVTVYPLKITKQLNTYHYVCYLFSLNT